MSPQPTESPASEDRTPKELSSSDKKRLRDRRAQRTLRERRDRQLKLLEHEVAECRRLHDPDEIRRLSELVRSLEEENDTLQCRQERLQSLLDSWNPQPRLARVPRCEAHHHHPIQPTYADEILASLAATTSSLLGAASDSPSTEHNLLPIVEPSLAATVVAQADKSLIPVTQLLVKSPKTVPHFSDLAGGPEAGPRQQHMPLSLEMLPPLVPAWTLVPSDEDPQSALSMTTCPWLARPDLIAGCPEVPSPLDLLHGTRRNFLANSIHQSLRLHHCRDPEVLAMGWVVYAYAKWRVSPSPRAFARIPACMKPVLGQLQRTHPSCLDQIIWPRLRLNIMQFCPQDRLLDAMNLLSCCLKVRWKWGEDILERDENDELQIRASFFDTFMTAEGWGITSEFIDTHPNLVDGIDLSQMLYVPT